MSKTGLGRGAGITWQRCDAIDYDISILTQALGEVDVERIVRRREDDGGWKVEGWWGRDRNVTRWFTHDIE
jgi:hypothetical protein